MMVTLGGYLFTLIARRPLGLQGTRGGPGAAPGWAAGAGAAGHVTTPELPGKHVWQRVDTRSAPCLDLKLVCGGTRSSGYRQWPSGPRRERLRTRRWGQFFSALLG
jgi:hypothetical protein